MKRVQEVKTPKDVFGNSTAPNVTRAFTQGEREPGERGFWKFPLTDEVLKRANLGFSLEELPAYIGVKGGGAPNAGGTKSRRLFAESSARC